LFLERFFVLLGVLFLFCGGVFFIAWNWEGLARWQKFAVFEAGFALFMLWSRFRWQGGSWDARIALFGAALLLGALLALHGQTYQSGADAWELFRAWTLLLLPFALLGRATAFWFLLWLVGSLWAAFYLVEQAGWTFYAFERDATLEFALLQFACLAAAEAARALAGARGIVFDPGRHLIRIVGSCAIMLLTLRTALRVLLYTMNLRGYMDLLERNLLFPGWANGLAYALLLGLLAWYYYKITPEPLFLSLGIYSVAFVLAALGLGVIFQGRRFEFQYLLPAGLLVLALFGGAGVPALRLHRQLRGRSGASLPAEGREADAAPRRNGGRAPEDTEAGQRLALEAWLRERTAVDAETLAEFFRDWNLARANTPPWYMRVFACLGVWLGSLLILGFLGFLLFSSRRLELSAIGSVGLALCVLSLFLDRSKSFALRQLGQVLGLCGLALALTLSDFREKTMLPLLAGLCAFFWLLKSDRGSRALCFTAMLFCCCLYQAFFLEGWGLFDYSAGAAWVARIRLYDLCLIGCGLFSLYFYAGPRRGPGHFLSGGLAGSAALGGLLFCALLPLLFSGSGAEGPSFIRVYLAGSYKLDLPILTGAARVFTALRRPAARPLAALAALALLPAGYFMPAAGLGLILLGLAYYLGRSLAFGLSALYLGLANFWHYYSLAEPLPDKSLRLCLTGALCLLAGAAAFFYGRGTFRHMPPVRARAVPAGAGRRRGAVLILILGGLFLAGFNISVAQKEHLLTEGRSVVLSLAPRDPRSLMQGDYMLLNFNLGWEIERRLPLSVDQGLAVLREEGGEHVLARIYAGERLEPGEILLEFRKVHDGIKIAGGSFFFQEGSGPLYDSARYALLKVDDAGRAMISALLDGGKKVIRAAKKQKTVTPKEKTLLDGGKKVIQAE
jgi:uncharacterized membrane-anchored protein